MAITSGTCGLMDAGQYRHRARSLIAPSSRAAAALAICVLLLGSSSARVARAGINVWTSNGPEGASISTVAIDPLAPTTIYAGSVAGDVFKTTDGTHWSTSNNGLPPSTSVLALAIDPLTPNTLYAGIGSFDHPGGLFKSTDGGASWNATGPTATYVTAVAIDPLAPTTVYAGTRSCQPGCEAGLFRSTDGFSTWKAGNIDLTPGTPVTVLAIDPLDSRTLYAGTNGAGVFKSADSGADWVPINNGLPVLAVAGLAIDPLTPSTLYAGTFDRGVFKSADGGANWRVTSIGNPGFPNAFALAIDGFAPETIYADVLDEETEQGGVSRSVDGGVSWSAVNRGLPGGEIHALASDRSRPATLYAGTSNGVFAFQPAIFAVTETADAPDANPGDGVCATAGGACTLRAAVDESNALPGGRIITVPADTYVLTLGGLEINVDLTLEGAGAAVTRIDGGGSQTVLRIAPRFPEEISVNISGVTIQHGMGGHNGGGGLAIAESGTLTLSGSAVRDNTTCCSGSAAGILNRGTLTLIDSTVRDNATQAEPSGGIENSGRLTLVNSTVSGNHAGLGDFGCGGGILNDGELALTNSTISGNSAADCGGGISNSGTLAVTNSTVSDNTAGRGSGISNDGTTQLTNAIVANNPGGDCSGPIISQGHNIQSDASCGFTGPSDLSNTDAKLGPLQDNGGQTFTHALLPGSPAIDAGDDAVTAGWLALATDQRGRPRLSGAHVDIGAFELDVIWCTGDCHADGRVSVDELMLMVNIALGNTPLSVCEAGDSTGDSRISVGELVAAVANALNGCPATTGQ